MTKYLTVSENGQIEINWDELELLPEEVSSVEMYLNGFYKMGHTVTAVESDFASVTFFLKDEKYFDGSIVYGAYVILTYNKLDKRFNVSNFGRSDLELFGYAKEGK